MREKSKRAHTFFNCSSRSYRQKHCLRCRTFCDFMMLERRKTMVRCAADCQLLTGSPSFVCTHSHQIKSACGYSFICLLLCFVVMKPSCIACPQCHILSYRCASKRCVALCSAPLFLTCLIPLCVCLCERAFCFSRWATCAAGPGGEGGEPGTPGNWLRRRPINHPISFELPHRFFPPSELIHSRFPHLANR